MQEWNYFEGTSSRNEPRGNSVHLQGSALILLTGIYPGHRGCVNHYRRSRGSDPVLPITNLTGSKVKLLSTRRDDRPRWGD